MSESWILGASLASIGAVLSTTSTILLASFGHRHTPSKETADRLLCPQGRYIGTCPASSSLPSRCQCMTDSLKQHIIQYICHINLSSGYLFIQHHSQACMGPYGRHAATQALCQAGGPALFLDRLPPPRNRHTDYFKGTSAIPYCKICKSYRTLPHIGISGSYIFQALSPDRIPLHPRSYKYGLTV